MTPSPVSDRLTGGIEAGASGAKAKPDAVTRLLAPPARRVNAARRVDAGTTRVRHGIARRLRSRTGRSVILLYHRVASPELDPWDVAVAPERFAEHMRMLAHCFRPLPVRELLPALASGSAPAGAVAVTFDDGYADNLLAAAPVLGRHGVPATVFAATEAIESGKSWWWDELTALLLAAQRSRPELVVFIDGRRHLWPTRDSAQRRIAHDDLQRSLRVAPAGTIAETLAQLRAWGEPSGDLPSPMTVPQLRRLADHGIDVGAHGHAHLGLHARSTATIERDVARSRDLLTDWLGQPPVGFAYPFGDSRWVTRRVVKRLGFPWAVSVRAAAATRISSRYDVPRVAVANQDAPALRRLIEQLGVHPADGIRVA